ncbi:MAG: ATP synthase F1 subunit delta [Deltaproteobacteria bacterium]|nr:ATP synthase F1 subunit delta [Deltaproteobacteria bacterium]
MKSSVARRYAKALIAVGREDGAYANYGKELRTALGIFHGTPELYKVLLNPMHRVEERRALVIKAGESASLSSAVTRLLVILMETRKIRLLPDVAAAYSRLEDELAGRLRAVVEAPFDLSPDALNSVRDKIKAATGRDVAVTFHKNAALIGGLVVRIDNTILDGSLKTQLDLMKEKILEGVA